MTCPARILMRWLHTTGAVTTGQRKTRQHISWAIQHSGDGCKRRRRAGVSVAHWETKQTRPPSLSLPMRMARAARLTCIEMQPTGSQVNAHRQQDGVTDEIIRPVGCLPGKSSRCGGRGAARNRVRQAVAKLVRHVEIKALALSPNANAEELAVHVRRERGVIGVRDRVLAKNVAG